MDKRLEQKIKDAADIVEVVGQFTDLSKKGVNYVGLCPLHEDRSVGSFSVDPRKNICSCWACGKTGLDPIGFLKEKGMTYKDALLYIAKLKHIDIEGNYMDVKIEKRKEVPPLPPIIIPKRIAGETVRHREENTLVKWLRALPWSEEQKARIDAVLFRYAVGEYTNRFGNKYTCYWQADEKGQLRSGKLMVYKTDGHRDKYAYPYKDRDGNQRYASQSFVHAWMREQFPKDKFDYKATFYGMHLLDKYPKAIINIVESEKTALIMSIAYGNEHNSIWMATGGMENLRREIMQPIIDRKRDVILYPDRDGITQWQERLTLINYPRMKVNSDVIRKHWKPEDGKKADIADIIVRCIRRNLPPSEIIDNHPEIKKLIDTLNLQLDNGRKQQ